MALPIYPFFFGPNWLFRLLYHLFSYSFFSLIDKRKYVCPMQLGILAFALLPRVGRIPAIIHSISWWSFATPFPHLMQRTSSLGFLFNPNPSTSPQIPWMYKSNFFVFLVSPNPQITILPPANLVDRSFWPVSLKSYLGSTGYRRWMDLKFSLFFSGSSLVSNSVF